MPLGLIWIQQMNRGITLQDIMNKWPEMSVSEIARIIEVTRRRYPLAANQRT